MSLRVAFDLDGTIADMHAELDKIVERLFGPPQSPTSETTAAESDSADEAEAPAIAAERQLTSKQQMRLWDEVKGVENFWKGLPELESGIVARIWNLVIKRRWEVIFLTTRPVVAGETVQIQSQRWLEAHGFMLPSVFVVQRSRGKVADALHLDAVVDDRPENCLDVAAESKARPILIWPGDRKLVPPGVQQLGIKIASSIGEAIDILEVMDDAQKQSGVVRSIKKLFGKETPA
jgi:hypothetical protein